jgi:hypothetical protein
LTCTLLEGKTINYSLLKTCTAYDAIQVFLQVLYQMQVKACELKPKHYKLSQLQISLQSEGQSLTDCQVLKQAVTVADHNCRSQIQQCQKLSAGIDAGELSAHGPPHRMTEKLGADTSPTYR